MRTLFGILGVIAGVVLGVYVGAWLCFIGGIIGLVTAFLALLSGKILVSLIAWSIIKIMFAGLAGWLSASVLIFPSWALIVTRK